MNQYMEIAIQEAKISIKKNHGGPFGAVIVKDGKVVSREHNRVLKNKDATCHAEIEAIKKASKKLHRYDLSDCEIYVTGKPCPMCKAAINWAKIKTVYYGCSYDDAKSIGFDEENGNSSEYEEKQIDQEACKKIFDEYKELDRLVY